jgi:hypothetical protein
MYREHFPSHTSSQDHVNPLVPTYFNSTLLKLAIKAVPALLLIALKDVLCTVMKVLAGLVVVKLSNPSLFAKRSQVLVVAHHAHSWSSHSALNLVAETELLRGSFCAQL